MATPAPQNNLSYERREEIIFANREKRAQAQPSWYHLAKSAIPDVYKEAQRLYQDQHRLEAIAELKTTATEKWMAVEGQIRERMAEEMTALDALEEHLRIWTICDPTTLANLLKGATTEQERLDVVLGSHIQLLIKSLKRQSRGIKKTQVTTPMTASHSYVNLQSVLRARVLVRDDVRKRTGEDGLRKLQVKAMRDRLRWMQARKTVERLVHVWTAR